MTTTVNLSPIVGIPFPQIENLQLEWVSVSTLGLKAGRCWDETATFGLIIPDDITIDASKNGANGLDSGSLANTTTYYIYVIGQQTGYSAPAALLSASLADPVMPYGYDLKKRVGVWRTNGSAEFLKIHQSGDYSERYYHYDAVLNLKTAGNDTAFTPIDVSVAYPAIDNLVIGLNISFTPATASNSVFVQSFGGSDADLTGFSGVVASEVQKGQLVTMAKLNSGVPTIEYKVSNASDAVTIDAGYYIDHI